MVSFRAAVSKDEKNAREQITQQLRFTPYPFEDVAQMISESSEDLYMFSSDYPHAEGGVIPSADSLDRLKA